MFRKLSVIAATVGLSLAGATQALAGNADKELPFGYTYTIVDQEGPGAGCAVPGEVVLFGQEVSFTGIGQALHMGRTVADVDFCVGLDPNFELRSYGTVELTAANGDSISFEFRGTPIDLVSATAEIIPDTTEGTGRFFDADVTGAGFAGEFGGYFDGTIAYDAANARG